MSDAEAWWPLFGLSVHTPRLTLTVPTDDMYAEICDVALGGVHAPDFMPFSEEWTDAPKADLARNAMQFLWSTRAGWTADSWHLEFAVHHQGRPIGMKAIWAENFSVTREFWTGSWLGLPYQGQGFGKEMRAAVLHLGFTQLAAEWAVSNSYQDNPASRAVNQAHGYQDDGFVIRSRRGKPAHWLQYRLAAGDWSGRHPLDTGITVTGLDACRDMFVGTPQP